MLRQARALKKRQDKKRRQKEKRQRESAARLQEASDGDCQAEVSIWRGRGIRRAVGVRARPSTTVLLSLVQHALLASALLWDGPAQRTVHIPSFADRFHAVSTYLLIIDT